ncbi:pyrophosphatase (plasmid) [Rhodococcus pseudokoreensis]|uniref:Pyrophosphatase n=1 Tax=Rhodococcus pseudokoreensis TaxID=2811421 RepID=A0A974VZD1_9NOCA|nr:pyrophosphatase [Rhodococcus pseudokoreensis]QSE88036.1 pyrophosphatase [Rhodococcus pseudokoreensis]
MDLGQLSDEVEEISKHYAERFGIERDAAWFLLKLQEEVGELTQSFLMVTGQARTKERSPDQLAAALRNEVADVLCQTLLLARFHDIDLAAAVNEKWLVWKSGDANAQGVHIDSR